MWGWACPTTESNVTSTTSVSASATLTAGTSKGTSSGARRVREEKMILGGVVLAGMVLML